MKKYSVLYVDDEEINLRLFKNTFRRDFAIFTVNSAAAALAFLEQQEVDVIITDQRMPDMTGVQLLEKINTIYSDIPPNRLIVSGYSENEDIELAFIPKPWDYENLKNSIIESVNQY